MKKAEIVIIGGGVVGASVAYHLTQRGARDVLILINATSEPRDPVSGLNNRISMPGSKARRSTWAVGQCDPAGEAAIHSVEQPEARVAAFSCGFTS